MKYYFSYYLVDSLSETIVGSFNAISDDVAGKMVKATIQKNKDLADIVPWLMLIRSEVYFPVCETYDEVSNDNHIVLDSDDIRKLSDD